MLILGGFSRPAPLASAFAVEDPGGDRFAILRLGGGADPTPTIVRLDEEAKPEAATPVDVQVEVAARVGGQAFLFAEKGITRLPGLDAFGDTPRSLEERRFVKSPFPGRILAVASGGVVAVLAGVDRNGAAWLGRFDGIESTPIPLPAGVPMPIEGAAVRAAPDGRFRVALRSQHEVVVLSIDASGPAAPTATVGARCDVPAGDGILVDLGDRLCLLADEDSRRVGVEVGFDPQRGSLGTPRRFATFGDGVLVGALPGTDHRRTALVQSRDRLASFAVAEGAVAAAPEPAALVPWRISTPRFERALMLHVALLFTAWLACRRLRRPSIAPLPGTIVPAPLPRRVGAFLIDAVAVALIVLPLRFQVLSEGEIEYWMRHAVETDSREVVTLVWDTGALFAIVFTAFVTVFEAAFGRTPGKWLFRLAVIEQDGGAPSLGAAAARGMFHLLDTLYPITWPMTAILLLWRRQRLGDMWAKTIVVRQL